MKYKPYSKYKDSGIEWIGEIPEGWEVRKLKHVVKEFIAGGTPNSDNEKFWAQTEDKGIPWVKIGDMTNKEIVKDTVKKITKEGLVDKRLRLLKKGTLIYSIFASLGKVSILGIDATTNQAILGLINSKNIDSIFLKYYLRNIEEPIIILSNANTQNNLNSTIVKNIEISIPEDKQDQTAIASFLDKKTAKIDKLIEKDKKLIEFLKEKRTALINHVVTKGLDPDAKLKDSGVEWIGEIPEGWEVHKLKFIADERKEKERYGKEKPLLGLENIESSTTKIIEYNSTENIEGEPLKFEKNDVLFGKLRPYLAKVTLVDRKGCSTSEIIIYKSTKKILPKFLMYKLISKKYIGYVNSFTYGVKMPRADPSTLSNIKQSVPPFEEQKTIVEHLDKSTAKIDKTIKLIERKINLMEEFKKSLIHHTVTGKINVKTVA